MILFYSSLTIEKGKNLKIMKDFFMHFLSNVDLKFLKRGKNHGKFSENEK